jgi:hypothetical protein
MGRQEVANAATASSPFLTEHADIIGWLDVLLKGKTEDQARARTEIGIILEERGFADDAEEAYWTNVQAGSADRRAYDRLIALYQSRKDRLSESLVRRKLETVFTRPAGATPLAPSTGSPNATAAAGATPLQRPATPAAPAQPVRRLRSAGRPDGVTPKGLDRPRPGTPAPARPAAPMQPATPARSVAPAQPSAPVPSAAPAQISRERLAEIAAEAASMAPRTAMARPAGRMPLPSAQRAQAMPVRAMAPMASEAVPDDDIVSAELAAPPHSRRRGALLPNPGGHRFRLSSGGLIALQPITIAAFLLASFGAAAIISILIISFDRGGVKTANAAPLQAPARCIDGAARFPGANDPRAAVAAAYKQQGVDVDAPRAGGPRLTAEQAELVVGGWLASSLLLEQAGQPVPTLAQWLDPSSDKATLANAILSGRGLDSMLSAEEWLLMRNWGPSTCGGGFLQDPRNAGLVRMIERVVSKN